MSIADYSNYKSRRSNINHATSLVQTGIVSEYPSDPFCLCISDSKFKNLWVVEVNTSELKNNDITIHGPAFHFVFGKAGVSAGSFASTISAFDQYDVNSAKAKFDYLFASLIKIEVYGTINGTSSDGYLTLSNILKNNTLNNIDDYEITAVPQAGCMHTGALVALIMSKDFGFLTYNNSYASCIAGNFNQLTNTNT